MQENYLDILGRWVNQFFIRSGLVSDLGTGYRYLIMLVPIN